MRSPSFVSMISPVESASSLPMGYSLVGNPLGRSVMRSVIFFLPLGSEVVQMTFLGLLTSMYAFVIVLVDFVIVLVVGFLFGLLLRSVPWTSILSILGSTNTGVPVTSSPLTETWPLAMSSSQSLLEAMPASAMTFCSLGPLVL